MVINMVVANVTDAAVLAFDPHPKGGLITFKGADGEPFSVNVDVDGLRHIAKAYDAVVKFGDSLGEIPGDARMRITSAGLAHLSQSV